MRRKLGLYVGAGALALAIAIPVIAQRGPTSLLPPGFGDATPGDSGQSGESDAPPASQPQGTRNPASAAAKTAPTLSLDLSGIDGSAASVADNASSVMEAELSPAELAARQAKFDLPAAARRSLDRIGPLVPEAGGLDSDAFGSQSGRFLAALMRESHAPFVSRWASILVRRALLSKTNTPGDINGADWAAERAWLLIRMGEADAARMMVQSVDADRFTPRMYSVAMQAYLATADMAGLCPLYGPAQQFDSTPGWKMANAICASFSGEQGTASALLNQAERRGNMQGIDYRLSEKMVGAGVNSRRSVKIEWDGVDQLTAWRFGLATAANVEIPLPLLNAAGSRVRAWHARAPMLSLVSRLPSVEAAARLGVFSSAALVDFYSQLASSEDAPDNFIDRAEALTNAYRAASADARIAAMRRIWAGREGIDYVGLLTVARAAASLPVTDADAEDLGHLIAAMLSAGYDNSAVRWAQDRETLESSDGSLGWALLAVGAPRVAVSVNRDRVSDYAQANGLRGQMLVASLAGLSRLNSADANKIAADVGFALGQRSRWSDAIDAAARRGEKGTVALLAAVGMQVNYWSKMPPAHLFHIVAALHRVGLNPEARMIAAEAVMRT